jgi:hypothetical protein
MFGYTLVSSAAYADLIAVGKAAQERAKASDALAYTKCQDVEYLTRQLQISDEACAAWAARAVAAEGKVASMTSGLRQNRRAAA